MYPQNIRCSKVKLDDLATVTILILALGFRTNFLPAERNISTIGIVFLFFVLVIHKDRKIVFAKSRKYIAWYTLVVVICVISRLWARVNVDDYIYALIKDTYIPFIFVMLTMEYYICKCGGVKRLIDLLVVAEMVTIIRVMIHTPWGEFFRTFDSRLIASGLGQNYNDFTTQMTMIALIMAYLGFSGEKKYKKWFWLFTILIILFGSRKSIVITVAGYFIFYLLGSRHSIKRIIKRITFLVAICGVGLYLIFTNDFLYELAGSKLLNMIQSLGLSSSEIRATIKMADIDHSMHGRAVLRELAWDIFKEHPILGIGYYNFQFSNSYGLYAHNNYLELLANLGIVGFTAYYNMYFIVILQCIKHYKKDMLYKFVLCFMGLLIAMEYAQVTFFRLFALIPLIVVLLWKDYNCKQREAHV